MQFFQRAREFLAGPRAFSSSLGFGGGSSPAFWVQNLQQRIHGACIPQVGLATARELNVGGAKKADRVGAATVEVLCDFESGVSACRVRLHADIIQHGFEMSLPAYSRVIRVERGHGVVA